MAIRILVVDDHRLIRRGLHELLAQDAAFEIIGEAVDTEEAIQRAVELHPDIVLMDINMPGAGGIEATRVLGQLVPKARVLILSIQEQQDYLSAALKAGAAGYVTKWASDSELTDAIRAVARGDIYIHPRMTRMLLQEFTAPPVAPLPSDEELTPRAKEVLRLLARGYTNRQIAEELSISVRTVEGHRASLMAKLGLRSRVDLVNYAEAHNLLD